MKNDLLVEYLTFEGEFIQEELEKWEATHCDIARQRVLDKRCEAAQIWGDMGNRFPKELNFAEH